MPFSYRLIRLTLLAAAAASFAAGGGSDVTARVIANKLGARQ